MSHFQGPRGEIAAAVSVFQDVGVPRPPFTTASLNAPILRFGIFEFDGQTLELRREGRLIHLRHQPALVLLRLLERPGQLVTRDEMTRELWPDDIDVDVEQGLNHCVKEIRAALGDRPDAPRYVQTLPRRGYRLLVEVVQVRASPLPASALPQPSPVLELGSPREANGHGRVRITLSASRSRDHAVLWTESYDHHAGELDGIERNLRAALHGGLRHALDAELRRPRGTETQTEDEDEMGAEASLSRRGFE